MSELLGLLFLLGGVLGVGCLAQARQAADEKSREWLKQRECLGGRPGCDCS